MATGAAHAGGGNFSHELQAEGGHNNSHATNATHMHECDLTKFKCMHGPANLASSTSMFGANLRAVFNAHGSDKTVVNDTSITCKIPIKCINDVLAARPTHEDSMFAYSEFKYVQSVIGTPFSWDAACSDNGKNAMCQGSSLAY